MEHHLESRFLKPEVFSLSHKSLDSCAASGKYLPLPFRCRFGDGFRRTVPVVPRYKNRKSATSYALVADLLCVQWSHLLAVRSHVP